MDIVLFGIQGSGKGTQGKAIAQKYNMRIFEMGGELRKLAKEDSELGRKVNTIITAGNLVPTEVVMEIVEDFINKISSKDRVLIDGIPRSIDQMTQFNAVMKKLNRNFKGVLIDIPKDMAIERLLARKICAVCKAVFPAFYEKDSCENCGGELTKRSDDNEQGILTRINAFETETLPVLQHYKNSNMLISIDGTQTIETVTEKLLEKLDQTL